MQRWRRLRKESLTKYPNKGNESAGAIALCSVSYTHLDVYKRQAAYQRAGLTVSLLQQALSLLFLAAVVYAAMRYFQAAPRP